MLQNAENVKTRLQQESNDLRTKYKLKTTPDCHIVFNLLTLERDCVNLKGYFPVHLSSIKGTKEQFQTFE